MKSTNERTGAAFTLVELLVVITIIGLLVGILVPVVRVALEQAELAKTKSWLVKLGGACDQYYNKYDVYPGQDDVANIGSPPKTPGSKYLAEKLMLGTAVYVGPQAGDLDTFAGVSNTIMDRTGNPMPVLYFVAKIGVSGVDQYNPAQNIVYVQGNSPNADAFPTFIKDTRFQQARPVNPGGFLLIAPGKDRQYYTGDDVKYPDF